ncbi:MAG: double-strand break repair helicase HerA and related ATPase [Candidatus Methanomethylophilaceae archaeon]|nr:double-strand break repair helicase HerA and related ATPase [Candidatus Methanomethylophilaceae archaeon]
MPKEWKAVKTAAETFRANLNFKTAGVIIELGTGEALASFLDKKGRPDIAESVFILPPRSFLGQIPDEDYRTMVSGGEPDERYGRRIDDHTAYEAIENAESEKAREANGREKATPKHTTTRKRRSYAGKATDGTVGSAIPQ